jgi:hypothetical protein
MTTLIPKFKQTGTGAVNNPIDIKLGETVSVLDFGADPTGTTDSYAAIMAAIASVNNFGEIYFPAGVYLTSDTITIHDTNGYPATSISGNNTITLKGDGMYSTYIVHTGTQTTGCLSIQGNVNWFPSVSKYLALNNGSSFVRDIALGSNYGPSLHCKFAAQQRHQNILCFSAGASSVGSFVLESTQMSTYENIESSLGNQSIPTNVSALINATLPLGAITVPVSCIYIASIQYTDGTHGSQGLLCAELFFDRCRSEGGCSGNSINILNFQGDIQNIYFSQCKFTGSSSASNPVVYINSVYRVCFSQCYFEPAVGLQSGLIIGSEYATSEVYITQSDIRGYVELGVTLDAYAINFEMDNSHTYSILLLAATKNAGLIKRLVLKNNLLDIDLAGDFASILDNIGTALVEDYFVLDNVWSKSGILTPVSYQTINNFIADYPMARGGLLLNNGGAYPIVSVSTGFNGVAPTSGTFTTGAVIFNNLPGAGQPAGWMCSLSGTFSAAATTGGITTATTALIVASASGFNINDYITIAGVSGVKRITEISGTAFTIDTVADATVVGAAVVTPNPTFVAMANCS